jgi:hypothetical protein
LPLEKDDPEEDGLHVKMVSASSNYRLMEFVCSPLAPSDELCVLLGCHYAASLAWGITVATAAASDTQKEDH